MVRKAVILAAGSASRMQENLERFISDEKELLAVQKGEKMAARFARFPFLDYQILNLIHAGLKSINLVLRRDDSFFIDHYEKNGKRIFPEVEISYSFQDQPDGTAHAVAVAERFVKKDRFLVLNGDNNYSTDSIQMLVDSPEERSSMVAYDVRGFNRWTRKKLKSFAVLITSGGTLKKIVEKPQNPKQFKTTDSLYSERNRRISVKNLLLVSMNLWCLQPEVLDACKRVERHTPRKEERAGEFELPDAVELFMKEGYQFLVFFTREDVLDLTRAEDIKIVEKSIQKNLVARMRELEYRYKGKNPL